MYVYVYKRTSEQRQRQLSLMLLAFEDIKQKQNERQRHLNWILKKKSKKEIHNTNYHSRKLIPLAHLHGHPYLTQPTYTHHYYHTRTSLDLYTHHSVLIRQLPW